MSTSREFPYTRNAVYRRGPFGYYRHGWLYTVYCSGRVDLILLNFDLHSILNFDFRARGTGELDA